MAFLDISKTVTTKAPDYLMMVSAGAIKYGEERFLSTTPVGTGTLKSAAVKGIIGIVAKEMLGGFWGNSVSLAFTTDAVEDALFAVMGANPATSEGNGIFGINAGNSSAAILPGAI